MPSSFAKKSLKKNKKNLCNLRKYHHFSIALKTLSPLLNCPQKYVITWLVFGKYFGTIFSKWSLINIKSTLGCLSPTPTSENWGKNHWLQLVQY
jgi:hypothetical protein